jgi:hypothetical protein
MSRPIEAAAVVPRAADFVADNDTVGQRAVVMAAMGVDGQDFAVDFDQQDRVVADMAGLLTS